MRPIVIGLCLTLGLATVPARADDASDAKNIEGDQNDLLHIESPPMPHPNLAGKVVRVIVTRQRDR
jgi:hypothetical protein